MTTLRQALANLLAAMSSCEDDSGCNRVAVTIAGVSPRVAMFCAEHSFDECERLHEADAIEAAEAALAVPAQVVTLTKTIRADGGVVFQYTADRRTARLVEQLAEALGAKVVRRG